MDALIRQIKAATTRRFLRCEKNIYRAGKPNSAEDLGKIEKEYDFIFPEQVRLLLLNLGQGEIGDFRIQGPEMIYPFDSDLGNLAGYITFATDILGNHFAFDPKSDKPEEIYYCSHDPLGYGKVASNIKSLLESFVKAAYDTVSVTDKVRLESNE